MAVIVDKALLSIQLPMECFLVTELYVYGNTRLLV